MRPQLYSDHKLDELEKLLEVLESTIDNPETGAKRADELMELLTTQVMVKNARRAQDISERFYQAAMQLGHPRRVAYANAYVGLSHYLLFNLEVGARWLKDALAQLCDLEDQRGESDVLAGLAREIKAKPRVYQANQVLSNAYEIEVRFEPALAHFKELQHTKEAVLGDEAAARIKNLEVDYEIEKSQWKAKWNASAMSSSRR